jgi:hypothetical protein
MGNAFSGCKSIGASELERGWKALGGDDSMEKRRQRLEGDEWVSGWPFKKESQQEREKPRIWKEDVDEMQGAWSKEAASGGR